MTIGNRSKPIVVYDNETTVYVVTHQPYVYACNCGCEDAEYKDIMLSQTSVEGIFESKRLAKAWMHEQISNDWEGDREYIKHQKQMHWSIEEHPLRKLMK